MNRPRRWPNAISLIGITSQMVETQECFYFKMFNPFTCLGAPLI